MLLLVSKIDNSGVPKGIEEAGTGVCLQVLVVSLGSAVTGPIVVDELVFEASEILGDMLCRVNGNIVVAVVVVGFCRFSWLITWAAKPPKRRRSKAIFIATAGSRSWDQLND